MTWALAGPPANPSPDALAAASLAHQNRATHSARLEPGQRSRSARSAAVNAVASKLGGRSTIGSTSMPTRAVGIEHGQGDGDAVGMGDRDGRQRVERGLAHAGQHGAGRGRRRRSPGRPDKSRAAGVVPEPAGGLLGRDSAPEPLRPPLFGTGR